MRRLAVLVVVIAAAAIVAAAVASTKSATVGLRSTSIGRVLVAANGHTLYMFTADKVKTSMCYGQCVSFWPPLLVSGTPSAGTGVKASLLGTTKRKNGKLQVAYAGHPLYFFAQDAKAGQMNGQGINHFGGSWWVVSASGTKITAKPTTATTPATTTSSGYGSGYGP